MLNRRAMVVILTVGLIKRHSINEWIFFKTGSFEKVIIELDLFNYATKTNLKNATEIDTSSFAKKINLASSKSDVIN